MTATVLIAGLPRSGTTWIGRVLSHIDDVAYVHEPDNHLLRPEAWWAKRTLGPHPVLLPGQEADDYEELWKVAFGGGLRPCLGQSGARLVHRFAVRSRRREGLGGNEARPRAIRLAALTARRAADERAGTTIVKSVFCSGSLEWIADRFSPAVVVVRRQPFAVIGSWWELGWNTFLDRHPATSARAAAIFGVTGPPPGAPWIDRAAWHYGVLSSLLEHAVARHPEWSVVRHEALCAEPRGGFRKLAGELGLGWTEEAEHFLGASNRPGRAYSTNRVWAEQVRAGSRLSPAQQERVLTVLARFRSDRCKPHGDGLRTPVGPVPTLVGAGTVAGRP